MLRTTTKTKEACEIFALSPSHKSCTQLQCTLRCVRDADRRENKNYSRRCNACGCALGSVHRAYSLCRSRHDGFWLSVRTSRQTI